MNPVSERLSTPADGPSIASLMVDVMGLPPADPAISADMQRWKYWSAHPLTAGSRSHVLADEATVVAHGARWPIRLRTAAGEFEALHLIDWAARRDSGGSGMQIMRSCTQDAAAVFSIGGSAMTRKLVPVFGFRPQNAMVFLERPLQPLQPAWNDSPRDWKLPARLLRNLFCRLRPVGALSREWSSAPAGPDQIPERLFPRPSGDGAASMRTAALLNHVLACPAFTSSRCCLLYRSGEPTAYFVLAESQRTVRLLDYGPAELSEETAGAMARAALRLASREFRNAHSIRVGATEPGVVTAFAGAGYRVSRPTPINVLKRAPELRAVKSFRLTLLDWDAACL